jgi:hypothetical protein
MAGSRESRACLVELSLHAPDFSFAPVNIKEGVEKIKLIAATNLWKPELFSLSSSIYGLVCHEYFPEIIPK